MSAAMGRLKCSQLCSNGSTTGGQQTSHFWNSNARLRYLHDSLGSLCIAPASKALQTSFHNENNLQRLEDV